jgi:hypothetical protein
MAVITANLTACHAQYGHSWGTDFAQKCQEEGWPKKTDRLHDLQKQFTNVYLRDWKLCPELLPKIYTRTY